MAGRNLIVVTLIALSLALVGCKTGEQSRVQDAASSTVAKPGEQQRNFLYWITGEEPNMTICRGECPDRKLPVGIESDSPTETANYMRAQRVLCSVTLLARPVSLDEIDNARGFMGTILRRVKNSDALLHLQGEGLHQQMSDFLASTPAVPRGNAADDVRQICLNSTAVSTGNAVIGAP